MYARCIRIFGGYEREGWIEWADHLAAHRAYMDVGRDKPGFRMLSAERIAELGGFGFSAVKQLLGRPPETWFSLAKLPPWE